MHIFAWLLHKLWHNFSFVGVMISMQKVWLAELTTFFTWLLHTHQIYAKLILVNFVEIFLCKSHAKISLCKSQIFVRNFSKITILQRQIRRSSNVGYSAEGRKCSKWDKIRFWTRLCGGNSFPKMVICDFFSPRFRNWDTFFVHAPNVVNSV